MLTVQTQSHEHMLRITAQDSQRRLLGAMEATQSSVVDVENIDALMPYHTRAERTDAVTPRLVGFRQRHGGVVVHV